VRSGEVNSGCKKLQMDSLGITSYGVSLASLEVFIKVTDHVEQEEAMKAEADNNNTSNNNSNSNSNNEINIADEIDPAELESDSMILNSFQPRSDEDQDENNIDNANQQQQQQCCFIEEAFLPS